MRLVDKYLSLCPTETKKPNFYLQLLQRPHPKQWYLTQVVGQNSIAKVVKTMMKDAKIEGFFTNHLTRRTDGTCFFRAGVQCKLVKETIGHSSDAIDKYQITSDGQRELMSNVIAGQQEVKVCEVPSMKRKVDTMINVENKNDEACKGVEGKVLVEK